MSKILRLVCVTAFFIFGIVSPTASFSDEGNKASEVVQSYLNIPFKGSAQDREEFGRFLSLVFVLCENIYPETTFKECMDNVKHGVGRAFDPHSGFLNAKEAQEMRTNMSGKFGGVGIEISKPASVASYINIVNVLPGTPAKRAGLTSGDAIMKINGISTTTLSTTQKGADLIRGDPGTSVELVVERKGVEDPIVLTLVREEIKIVQVEATLLRSGDKTYALLAAKMFNSDFAREMKTKYLALRQEAGGNLSGLIISVENNPGGLLDEVYNAVDLFIDAETFLLERTNDGTVRYEPNILQRTRTPGDITDGLPILVVVNGGSASASEIFAGAMKHFGRAVVAGTESTFGKGSVQLIAGLSAGEMVKMTSAEYLIGTKQDWVPVQCIGVTPDILFTYDGIKPRKGLKECELGGRLSSGGVMKDAPKRQPIKEKNPLLYQEAENMLEAYKLYRLPELQEEEKRIRLLEKSQ